MMDIKEIHHMNGIYEASLKLTQHLFSNKQFKAVLNKMDTTSGNVQICKFEGGYYLLFTYKNNEQIIIDLSDLKRHMKEWTRGNKYTRIKKHNALCYWKGQSINCSVNLKVPGGAFGKRLRRIGFDVIVVDGGGETFDSQSQTRWIN